MYTRSQKRVSDFLELELKMIVRASIWVLELDQVLCRCSKCF